MANFFDDNEDLQYYLREGVDWETVYRTSQLEPGREPPYADWREARDVWRDVLEMVGGFSADEIAPHAHELDTQHQELVDGEVVTPPRMAQIFEQLAELGLHGLCVPEAFGGMGAPLLIYQFTAELIARGDVSVMTHHGFHGGMAMAMLAYSAHEGTTEVDREAGLLTGTRFIEYIEEIVAGEAWGCMDITEPDAGSDMAALRCRGEQDDDGNWYLTGQKIFITSGHGRHHFVIARTEDAAGDDPMAGLNGLSFFLAQTYTDTPEGRVRHAGLERLEEKIGHHASATLTINFERTPAQLIGERGQGFRQMLLLMNNARIAVGFESLGICEAAWRAARDYAAGRPSMGKTIDRHEIIADYLDQMKTEIQGLRALSVQAALRAETAQRLRLKARYLTEPDSLEASQFLRRSKALTWQARQVTPLVKFFGAEKAVEMARRCMQIHGGVGYTTEYGAEKLLRDALVLPIYEGTSQIQALMATKDNLLAIGKDFGGFLRRLRKTWWAARFDRDPLTKRVAALRHRVLRVEWHLMMRVLRDKLGRTPIGQWRTAMKAWDTRTDFAPALLHAERLTWMLADAAICEALLDQARRHPLERQDVLDRYLERAEPRSHDLNHRIRTTGARLLAALRQRSSAPSGEATAGSSADQAA